MKRSYLLAIGLAAVVAAPASAAVTTYTLFNHSAGNAQPPPYGLRIDDLIDDGDYTFDFEYTDGTETALMKLDYDDTAMTVHIYGRAYGGKDTGSGYDATQQGWINVDFTYTTNVIQADNAAGDPGNDIYVTAESPLNAGTLELDGWGGNVTFDLMDKQGDNDHSFRFDNDFDPRDAAAAANPMIQSATGWVDIPGVPLNGGSRDWLFFAEVDAPTSVESSSWGSLKGMYR